ncbi:MAG: hypothetical protein WBE75_06660 [Candidatus Omnitrophota bacterium]
MHLRCIEFNPRNNNLNLLLDKGDTKDLGRAELIDSTRTLMEYFLIGLILPNSAFWVNLRPDEGNSIIDPYLEKTDIGRILLEADLNLKKDLALATSPQTREGAVYWDKLYRKAKELFGEQRVSLPAYTRPWIVPGEIIIRRSKGSAYIYKAALKVMLEQDYLKDQALRFEDPRLKELNEYSSGLIRELILPKLTQRVNASKNYASLRQVYYSLILSQWFKRDFRNKITPYRNLIDRKDLTGLVSKNPWLKTCYFTQYKQSFQKGEYNESETVFTPYGQTIRQYTSGGIVLQPKPGMVEINADIGLPPAVNSLALTVGTDGVLSEPAAGAQNKSVAGSGREIRIADGGSAGLRYIEQTGDISGSAGERKREDIRSDMELLCKNIGIDATPEEKDMLSYLIYSKNKQSRTAVDILKQDVSKTGLQEAKFYRTVNERATGRLLGMAGIREGINSGEVFSLLNKHDFPGGDAFEKTLILLGNIGSLIYYDHKNPNQMHGINEKVLLKMQDYVHDVLKLKEYRKIADSYDDFIFLLAMVVHSQSWLSPGGRNILQGMRLRGILQGDNYVGGYERAELYEGGIEASLTGYFDGSDKLLFRNAEAGSQNMIESIMGDMRKKNISAPLIISKNFPFPAFGAGPGRIAFSGPETLAENDAAAVFMNAGDVDSIEDVLKAAAGRDRLKYVVIYYPHNGKLPKNIAQLAGDKQVYCMYDLDVTIAGRPLVGFPFLLDAFNPDEGLWSNLKNKRSAGLKIDSFYLWYLSFLLDRINNDDLDTKKVTVDFPEAGVGRSRELVSEELSDNVEYEWIAVRRTELLEKYRRLSGKIRSVTLSGFLGKIGDLVLGQAERNLSILEDSASSETLVRTAVKEYRTLFRYYIYMQWMELMRKEGVPEEYAHLESKAEASCGALVDPVKDRAGKAYPVSTLIFDSGMGAVKTLLSYLASDERGILVGNGTYYEIELLQKQMENNSGIVTRLRDQDAQGFIDRVKTGAYKALFIDPISNSARRIADIKLTDLNLNAEDMPVADLKTMLEHFVTLRYEKPFYLFIDVSLFATMFQLPDFINNAVLPENLNIVLFSSLQKLHQEGMEFTTGGALTLISGSPENNDTVMDSLRAYQRATGTRPSLYSCLALNALDWDREKIDARARLICRNTADLARFVLDECKRNGLIGAEVIHPGLEDHPDHELWKRNNSLPVPFFMLRIPTFTNSALVKLNSHANERLFPVAAQNSFGFDTLGTVLYFPESLFPTGRINPGTFNAKEMAELKDIFKQVIQEVKTGIDKKYGEYEEGSGGFSDFVGEGALDGGGAEAREKTKPDKKGGIDFRALAAGVQPASGTAVSLKPAIPLENLDKELDDIRGMIHKGIIPSGEKIRNYAVSIFQKRDVRREVEEIRACILEILRLEEDYALDCEPGFVRLISVLEFGGSTQTMRPALSEISFQP